MVSLPAGGLRIHRGPVIAAAMEKIEKRIEQVDGMLHADEENRKNSKK